MVKIAGKEYEVRDLKAKDVFALLRILKKMDLKKELDMIKVNAVGAEAMAYGYMVLEAILFNLEVAEGEIYEFLASFVGLKPRDIAEADPTVLIDLIKEISAKESFTGFFVSAMQAMSGKPSTTPSTAME